LTFIKGCWPFSDVEIDGEYAFERRRFGSNPAQLRLLAEWLLEQQVEEVVMEIDGAILETGLGSPGTVMEAALPEATRGPSDVRNAACGPGAIEPRAARAQERFPRRRTSGKRLVAQELTLSFVPDSEQRLWWTLTRAKPQQRRNRVQLQNRLEALREEAHINLSSLISDLLGVGARRMLKALAEGRLTRGLWPPSPIIACAPRRNSWAMRGAPASSSTPSTVAC
jgi:hypothetical protein